MGVRRRGRIIAFQALYGWEYTHAPVEDLVGFNWLHPAGNGEASPLPAEEETELAFPRLLVAGTIQNIEIIDRTIRDQLEHWDFSRVIKVDLAILRMSVYALLYQRDIPASVTIDEAIDIAKAFGTDESYKFVNGVLDGIRRNLSPDSPGAGV